MWPSGPVTHYNIPSQKKNPRIFQSLGRSPGTIRPLAKFFAFLLSLGRLPKTIWSISNKQKKQKKNKKQKKWDIFQMTCSLCKSHMSIYYFQSFSGLSEKQKFFCVYFFFLYKFTTQSQRKIKFSNDFVS